jgi:hypothetical protein
MVKLKEQTYSINHQYRIYVDQESAIAIGTSTGEDREELILYPKSLPLGEDMDRIPIIRAVHIYPIIAKTIVQLIKASGNYSVEAVCNVWNGSEETLSDPHETMDLLAKNFLVFHLDDAATEAFALMQVQDTHHYFQGGIMGKNKITIVNDIIFGANVAGAAFPTSTINFDVFIEVDWKPVTKSEFQAYITELALFLQD